MKKRFLLLMVVCAALSCIKEPPDLNKGDSSLELNTFSAKKDPEIDKLKDLFALSYPQSELDIKWQQARFVRTSDTTILALAPLNVKLEEFGIERDSIFPINEEEKKVKPSIWVIMLQTPQLDSLKGDTLRAFVSVALPTFEYHKRSKNKKDYANALSPMDFCGTIFVASIDRKVRTFSEYCDGNTEEHSHNLDIFAANGKDPETGIDPGRVYCTCCGKYYIKDGIWDEVSGPELDDFIVGLQQLIRDGGIGLFCSMYQELCGEREPCPKCQQYSCVCPPPDPEDGGKGDPPKPDPGDSGGELKDTTKTDPPTPIFNPTETQKFDDILKDLAKLLNMSHKQLLNLLTDKDKIKLYVLKEYTYIAQCRYNKVTGEYELVFDGRDIADSSKDGVIITIAHELQHLFYFEMDILDENLHHNMMILDGDFEQLLRDLIPGKSDDWYQKSKYSGNQESSEFPKDDESRDILNKFFDENEIPRNK